MNPENVTPEQTLKTLFNKSHELIRQGDYEKAVAVCDMIVQRFGKDKTLSAREKTPEEQMYVAQKAKNRKIVEIQKSVANYYKIKLDDLLSRKHARSNPHPRQVAMWLCKKLAVDNDTMIGMSFDGRDFTNIRHAYGAIEEMRKLDNQLDHDLTVLEAEAVELL